MVFIERNTPVEAWWIREMAFFVNREACTPHAASRCSMYVNDSSLGSPETETEIVIEFANGSRTERENFCKRLSCPQNIVAEKMLLFQMVVAWLTEVDKNTLRDVGESRNERFSKEAPYLNPLPTVPFDYRQLSAIGGATGKP